MSETTTDSQTATRGGSSDASRQQGADATIKPRPLRRSVLAIAGTLPTLVVLAALGGLGYWGHRTGWKVPEFSELAGTTTTAVDDWCPVHNVPESECVECIPALLPNQTDYGWCKIHGVHQCPLCHPDVAHVKTTPEVEHSLLAAASLALAVRDRQENNLGCTLYRNRVQFTSIDAVEKAGVEVELVETRPIVESFSANGEITYDETRVAHLSSRVPGTIWRVDRNVGDRVKKGDVLALIDSADVGKSKAELLDALAQIDFHSTTVERLAPLYEKRIISGSRMLQVETALQQASIHARRAEQSLVNLGLPVGLDELKKLPESDRASHLQFLGLSDEIRAQVATSTTSNNLIPLVASIDGVVTYREAVPGEVVGRSEMVFQLADTSNMWLRFNVALEDAGYLAAGQAVRFEPDGVQEEVHGEISWISTDVDKQTRTVEVRAEVNNVDGKLRNETFGLGHVILRDVPEGVVVPSQAVHWDGACFVVFVRDRDYFEEDHPKIFHTRTVRLGVKQDGFTEIIAGLLPGEVVATEGSSVLRSQILRNNLGAGCTCH